MKVKELITKLQKINPELIVTIPGYESGLDPIKGIVVTKATESPFGTLGGLCGQHNPEPTGEYSIVWLYGPHRHHSLPWENE